MNQPPSPPPYEDWQSPEVGNAIRVILDVWDGIGEPQHEVTARFQRLGLLNQQQPEVVMGAFFGLFNAALGLPAVMPVPRDRIPEVRDEIERKVYADINEMPPPKRPPMPDPE